MPRTTFFLLDMVRLHRLLRIPIAIATVLAPTAELAAQGGRPAFEARIIEKATGKPIPNAEVTIYPWKDSQEHIDEVVAHARRFLAGHARTEV